jgi:hypothetical protein
LAVKYRVIVAELMLYTAPELVLDSTLCIFCQILLKEHQWETLYLLVHRVTHYFLLIWVCMVGGSKLGESGQEMTRNEVFSALQMCENNLLHKLVSLVQTDVYY